MNIEWKYSLCFLCAHRNHMIVAARLITHFHQGGRSQRSMARRHETTWRMINRKSERKVAQFVNHFPIESPQVSYLSWFVAYHNSFSHGKNMSFFLFVFEHSVSSFPLFYSVYILILFCIEWYRVHLTETDIGFIIIHLLNLLRDYWQFNTRNWHSHSRLARARRTPTGDRRPTSFWSAFSFDFKCRTDAHCSRSHRIYRFTADRIDPRE